MAAPLVSVLVPVRNGAAFLAEALASITAQQHAPLEIIVIDDGSTDASPEIATQTTGVRCVRQPPGGVAAARNRGLAEARGEIIAFLDADDLWPAGRLARQLAAFAAAPELAIVQGRIQCLRRAAGGAFAPYLEPCFYFNLGAALFRRGVFERVGIFDPALAFCEDADWFLRARELAVPCVQQPEIALFYRRHGANMTAGKSVAELGFPRVLKRALDRRRQSGRTAPVEWPRCTAFDP